MRAALLAAPVGLALLSGGTGPAAAAPCVTIAIEQGDRLGFRNACGGCRVAVWAWGAGQSVFSRGGKVEGVWQGGKTWTRSYAVPAHGRISVREEAPIGKLLREKPCRTPGERNNNSK